MIILRQKQYAAISEKGAVIMKSKDALEEARRIRKNWDTSESSATIAKRILDMRKNAADESDNKWYNKPYIRKAIGFKKKYIQSHPDEQANWTRIGFHPDYTEPTGQTVKLGFRKFSKQDREVVPADIVKKVKDGDGVIQKDHNGDWRIVSMKTNPPTFWDAHYNSKALASKALGGYFANKK